MLKHALLLPALILLLAACSQRSSENLDVDMDELGLRELRISSETMNDIIQNIASPIDVAALIITLDVPYSTQYLADPDLLPTTTSTPSASASSLSTTTSRIETAFYLGALSADLGYLNIYGKTGTAINCLSGINRLAEALEIGQLFELPTIEQLATTGSDPDSLMFLSVNSFNNMDDLLRETDRGNLSAMMITGVWIEGLYLATQVATENSNKELKSMIGEQKLILNDLILILSSYNNEEAIVKYIQDLERIKRIYDKVKITYEVGVPQTIERDGTLIVVQSESSHVLLNDATLQKIIEAAEQVRNMRMNLNGATP